MAQYRVKNTSHLDKAFKVYGGFDVVAAGASKDVLGAVDLTEAQIATLATEGVRLTVIETDDNADLGGERDENGDTSDLVEMRRTFDASLKQQGDVLADAQDKVANLTGKVADLQGQISAKDTEIAALKKQIEEAESDKSNERDDLKKQAAELKIEFPRNITTEKLKELVDAKLAS